MPGQLPQLPKEVWTCIAYHLRQPFPQPRDVKDRTEIRQVDLVNMMRVSKLLNNATAPALYSLIITDDIYGLYYNFSSEPPVAPGILSKRELLHFARALYLEYPIRPLSEFHTQNIDNFSYPPLPAQPFGSGCYIIVPTLASLIDSQMFFATQPATQLQNAMPELEVLSTGTFFGAYEDGWMSNFGDTLGYMRNVGEIQKIYTRMLLSGKIKHYCQSGNMSPLAIHPGELHDFTRSASPPSSLRTITLHVDLRKSKDTDYDDIFASSSSLPDVRVRWCFDNPRPARCDGIINPFLGFDDQPIFAKAVCLSMISGLSRRHEKKEGHSGSDPYTIVPFTVDAYIPLTEAVAKMLLNDTKVHNPRGSTAKEKSINKKRVAAGLLGTALAKELFHTDVEGKVLHEDDHLGVQYVADCPACPGCGWVALA